LKAGRVGVRDQTQPGKESVDADQSRGSGEVVTQYLYIGVEMFTPT